MRIGLLVKIRRMGPPLLRFWQAGTGQDRNVYDTATAPQIVEYVHDNPVRRDLASRAVDWPWSSARAWAGDEDALVSIDRTIPTTAEWPVGWP